MRLMHLFGKPLLSEIACAYTVCEVMFNEKSFFFSHLFNLAQHSPVHTAKSMQTKLKEIQKRFCELSKETLMSSSVVIIFKCL